MSLPFWTRGDLNAFFGLGINMLVNVLMLIIIGFVSGVRLPGNVPMGIVALGIGTTIAWIGGFMEGDAVSDGVEQIAVGLPSLDIGAWPTASRRSSRSCCSSGW